MAVTFAVEVIMAVYVLWRYKLNAVSRLAALILLFLATFQLAEFMVCTGNASMTMWWTRVGYIAITALPPLGLHLAYELAKAERRTWLWPAYDTAMAFAAYFLLAGHAFSGQACLGNYVIFELAPWASGLYAVYYYGWLAIGVILAAHFIRSIRIRRIRLALSGLIVGYGVFIVPTVAVNLIAPDTTRGIPSIMCGFAVLFAFILVGWVLPVVAHKKRAR